MHRCNERQRCVLNERVTPERCALNRGVSERLCQILIVTGSIFLAVFIMAQFGPMAGNLKRDIRNLRDSLNSIKLDVTIGLANIRKEFEKKLREKEIKLRICIFNDMKMYILKNLNESAKKIIKDAIDLYDADKTGMADYALETLGAYAEVTGDTESLEGEPPFLGEHPHSVQCMITPIVSPGHCWAFRGSKGSAVIHLVGSVYITAVSLEHIPAAISPTGEISDAPREFTIWGLICGGDEEKIHLGKFEYNKTGHRIQYFKMKDCKRSFSKIEVRIHSNHGNSVYTCVYRLRVHGFPNLI
ncbi:hypothetical protein L9F63_020450 [Diploptera punctata]|uniref:SUN domain-containing protein n=1 Tax=Diploptera punctata TaxID=6984 RepID=A0AAD7ZTP0_DIPPU|nr:hypothetical protein L9F63_020450 [Diploptera punctata]